MKKTLTVNLNNIVFHIDDDAYEMLQVYLADVARHLSEDEKKEVMNDIEARVAELFTERLQKNKNVVNIEDVQEIINVLGKPSQYADGEDTQDAPPVNAEKKKARRFYRNPENAILGGIGGGIAAYFGWDVTWVRIVLVILALISAGNMVLIYLLIWIIAPAATSVSQRLEMQGEDVTVESIKTEINNVKNYVESDKFKQSASTMGQKILEFLQGFFKIVFGFVGAVFGLVGIILIGALILVLMFFIFEPSVFNGFSNEFLANSDTFAPDKIIMLIVSLILVVGCPIFMLIYWAIRIVSGRNDYSKTTSWVVLILWIAGLFMLSSTGASTIYKLVNNPNHNWVTYWTIDESQMTDEVRTCEDFDKIEISGNVKLEFTQDSVTQVVVSAPNDNIASVITKVEDGVLKIYSEKFFLNREIEVKISTDSIFGLEATGASRFISNSRFNTSKLYLKLSGASQADLDINVYDKLDIDLSGASNADLEGNTNELKADISGASKLEAVNLISKFATLNCSGAANAKVYATEKLDAEASGASHILCEGNPKTVRKSDHISSAVEVR